MFHRSQRLLLRPIWPEDWEGVFSGIADKDIVRNLATAPWPYTKQHARDFARLPCDPAHPRFLITLADNAEIIGCMGLRPDQDAMELGYWIARCHWGQGFATEAGEAVLQIARMLGYSRILASHFEDNPASGRVLQKLGFRPTGRRIAQFSCGRGAKAMTREHVREWSSLSHFTQDKLEAA